MMRTTLDLDSDVLQTAKELAKRQGKTAGQVISELVRRALTQQASAATHVVAKEPPAAYGFQPFASRGGLVTNELIDRLREEGEG